MEISPFYDTKIAIYWCKIFYHMKYQSNGDDMFPFICTCLFRDLRVKISLISSQRKDILRMSFTLIFNENSPYFHSTRNRILNLFWEIRKTYQPMYNPYIDRMLIVQGVRKCQ